MNSVGANNLCLEYQRITRISFQDLFLNNIYNKRVDKKKFEKSENFLKLVPPPPPSKHTNID